MVFLSQIPRFEGAHFEDAIKRAKEACQNSGFVVDEHFADVRKMVQLGSGSQRNV